MTASVETGAIATARRSLSGVLPADPEPTPERLARAEAALDGVVHFHDYTHRPIRVGRRGVDWSGGHVDHQEWRAQLNRFFPLADLAAAWRSTGRARYLAAARESIEDWMDAHPAREAWAPASYDTSLNLSIRVGNSRQPGWLGFLEAAETRPGAADTLDVAFVERVVESVRAQLGWLEEHLTGVGNWRISEADTLASTAYRLPGAAEADRWRETGVRVLREAALCQVLPDGVHTERVPGYHAWMAGVFASHWRLGRVAPEHDLGLSAERIAAMHGYAAAVRRPCGREAGLHDDEGAAGGPQAAKRAAIDAEREAFRREAGLPDRPVPLRHHFRDAGQVVIRDGHGADAAWLSFDATPWSGSHSHLSRNAIQLDHAGRPLLVDPGRLSYERSDPLMAHGRGTRAHNTANLNGWNQAPAGPGPVRHAHREGFDLIEAQHDAGFAPTTYHWRFAEAVAGGIWARHHRMVFRSPDGCVLVADSLRRITGLDATEADRRHRVELNWQFAFGPVHLDPEAGTATVRDAAGGLKLWTLDRPAGCSLEVLEGRTDPPAGWIGGQEGVVPAPQLRLDAPMTGDYAEFVTLLCPHAGDEPPVLGVSFSRPDPLFSLQVDVRLADGRSRRTRWATRLCAPLAGSDGRAVLVHGSRDAASPDGGFSTDFRCLLPGDSDDA